MNEAARNTASETSPGTVMWTGHLWIIASVALVSGLMHGPINSVLPALYASRFGLDLALLGTLLLAARVFDAVTDPLIGIMSDRTRSKYGQRKPWIVAGSLLVPIGGYLLFSPIDNAGAAYFLLCYMLLYLAWTIQEIPAGAWVLEMSRDTKQRARINGYRGTGILLGTIAFTVAPLVIPAANGSMNFEVLHYVALAMFVAVPVSTFLLVRFVPQGESVANQERPRFSEIWSSLRGNRPFLVFVVAYLFLGMHYGFWWSLAFIFIDSYLGLGTQYTALFLPFFLAAPLAVPIWVRLMNRFGKYRVVTLAYGATLFFLPAPWFIQPGEHAFAMMLAYFILSGLFYPLFMVPMMTILGDIIDYDEVKTGKNRSAQYMSVLTFMAKTTQALGISLALIVVGLAGYQPGAEVQSEQGVLGLRAVYSFFPAITLLPAVLILWKFPINDENQKELQRDILALRSTQAEQTT